MLPILQIQYLREQLLKVPAWKGAVPPPLPLTQAASIRNVNVKGFALKLKPLKYAPSHSANAEQFVACTPPCQNDLLHLPLLV